MVIYYTLGKITLSNNHCISISYKVFVFTKLQELLLFYNCKNMSDEDNTKKPKFVIPESSEGKPINKLLVPKGDKSSDEESSKPKLATSDSSTSSDEDEKVKKILIPNQESIGDSEPEPEP